MKARELKDYLNKLEDSLLEMDVEVQGDAIRLTVIREVSQPHITLKLAPPALRGAK